MALITVALSATIAASQETVWRALVDPSLRPLWDDRILGEAASSPRTTRRSARDRRRDDSKKAAAPSDQRDIHGHIGGQRALPGMEKGSNQPSEGHERAKRTDEVREPLRKTRWRFKMSGIALVMHDEILEATRRDRLVSRIAIGSMHFDQTITLHTFQSEEDESGPRIRVGMKLVARNSIAVLGEVVPRLDVQRIVIEYVDTTLRQVQKYCESGN